MLGNTKKLYKVEKKDIRKASAILVEAFQHDPFWKKVLEKANVNQKLSFFESGIKYCFRYGKVYATSENLEGIIVRVSSDFANMTIWRMIRSGSLFSGMKTGMKLTRSLMKAFKLVEEDRKANMRKRQHIYLMIVGVASKFQGQGLGRKLLKELIKESEEIKNPIYVETTNERTVEFYEKLGFKTIKKILLPIVNLPQWEMIREPKT